MAALARACIARQCHAEIVAVLSDRPAKGLQLAEPFGFKTAIVDRKSYADSHLFETALAAEIDQYGADLIVLAGFMRVLSQAFVEPYLGRMINIHPSLLPSFAGLNTHQRALKAGVKWHGATVHFVTAELDGGPIIAQAAVPIFSNDTIDLVSLRVLAVEHQLLPKVANWCVEKRARYQENRVIYSADICQKDIAWMINA